MIHSFLKSRLDHAYRELEHSLEGVDEAEARWGADPGWRQARHGAGLDGSIQGVVRHVATWKHVVADGLDSGTDAFPDAEAVLPHEEGWPVLRAWLGSGQLRLVRDLDEIPPNGLERAVTVEGVCLPLHALFALMLEHDHYHAGQVNLLRQQFARRSR